MKLTKEQMEYVMKNQRSPENAKGLAEAVRKLAERYPDKAELQVTPEELSNMVLVSNIGEFHPDMLVDGVSIYSMDFGKWDDSDKGKIAKELNATRGEKSVEMALGLGIQLNPEVAEAIEATSSGKSSNLLALLMKAAQTYKAVQQPRWSRGVKKAAAKNFEEIEEILKEELEFMMKGQEITLEAKEKLISEIVESARTTYSIEKPAMKAADIVCDRLWWSVEKVLVELGMEGNIGEPPEKTQEFWEGVISRLNAEEIDTLMSELESAKDEKELAEVVKKYKSPVKKLVLEATADISPSQAMELIDEMNPDKNREEQR